jgi:polyhydroxyalkanoate synthase
MPDDSELREAIEGHPDAVISQAVGQEAQRRFVDFVSGVSAYHRHPYRRQSVEHPVLWRGGSATLTDHSERSPERTSRPTILFVPSLVNRSYILDLKPGNSLMDYLAERGMRPLLLDWGAPNDEELAFDLDAYVNRRLLPALEAAVANGGPVILTGYCMGGLLALAAAQLRPETVKALALMAVPWDFHHTEPSLATAAAGAFKASRPVFTAGGAMSVEAIQTFFAALDPMLAARKFASFASLDPESQVAETFVALEDWLNDGTPLPSAVAIECMKGWYGENSPLEGNWFVSGQAIQPEIFGGPVLALIPDKDRIVPPESAMGLARKLPDAQVRIVRAGHIGMIAGSRAEKETWQPLGDWVEALALD